MLAKLKEIWFTAVCFFMHRGNYTPKPELDGEGVKGIYCAKCAASFTVQERVYKRIFKE